MILRPRGLHPNSKTVLQYADDVERGQAQGLLVLQAEPELGELERLAAELARHLEIVGKHIFVGVDSVVPNEGPEGE